MIERQQVNLRLERDLVDSLDDLARGEHVDRTEIARRILVDGIARARVDRAVREYRTGRATAWKAARDADISLYEMLDRIHEAGIPYEIDSDELGELASSRRGGRKPRAAESPAEYGGHTRADADSGVDELQSRYKPEAVKVLFVGESSPAQGTHFYRANSNLFRATRAAFARALGEENVPAGEAFLRFFRDQGCWFVDLADRPVNQLPEAERRDAVRAGVAGLAATIRAVQPERLVAVKRDIADTVREAIALADADGTSLHVLPFPVRQWTPKYEAGLAALLREMDDEAGAGARPRRARRVPVR